MTENAVVLAALEALRSEIAQNRSTNAQAFEAVFSELRRMRDKDDRDQSRTIDAINAMTLAQQRVADKLEDHIKGCADHRNYLDSRLDDLDDPERGRVTKLDNVEDGRVTVLEKDVVRKTAIASTMAGIAGAALTAIGGGVLSLFKH